MSLLKKGSLAGAGLAVGAFTANMPVTPADFLDPAVWFIYAFIAAAGAFFGASVVLAGRHAWNSPRVLLVTLAGLLLISQPPVSGYLREKRANQRFLSTASSTQGVVTNKYVRGVVHLFVDYRLAGRTYHVHRTGQAPAIGTLAFQQWKKGDAIPVYFQPAAPAVALVGEPGPERGFLIQTLVKLWAFWGLMLTAYLPLVAPWVRRWILLRGDPVPVHGT